MQFAILSSLLRVIQIKIWWRLAFIVLGFSVLKIDCQNKYILSLSSHSSHIQCWSAVALPPTNYQQLLEHSQLPGNIVGFTYYTGHMHLLTHAHTPWFHHHPKFQKEINYLETTSNNEASFDPLFPNTNVIAVNSLC